MSKNEMRRVKCLFLNEKRCVQRDNFEWVHVAAHRDAFHFSRFFHSCVASNQKWHIAKMFPEF